jgi:hypothetical protein
MSSMAGRQIRRGGQRRFHQRLVGPAGKVEAVMAANEGRLPVSAAPFDGGGSPGREIFSPALKGALAFNVDRRACATRTEFGRLC